MKITKIQSFSKSEFGSITTIMLDGMVMFLGSDIAKIWGHTNLTQAIKGVLKEEDFCVISLKYEILFKKHLIKENRIGVRSAKVIVLTTEGMIKLVLNSEKFVEKQLFLSWLRDLGLLDSEFVFLKQRKEMEFASLLIPMAKIYGFEVIQQFTVGKYRLDFYVKELKLCIEHDGISHKGRASQDRRRDAFLKKENINTLRIVDSMEYGEALAYLSYIFNKYMTLETCQTMSFVDSLLGRVADLKSVSELSLRSALPLFKGLVELGEKAKEGGGYDIFANI